MIWLGENMNWLSYIELAREVNRLCKTVETLMLLLEKKGITTIRELDSEINESLEIADENFDEDISKEIYGDEEREHGKFSN